MRARGNCWVNLPGASLVVLDGHAGAAQVAAPSGFLAALELYEYVAVLRKLLKKGGGRVAQLHVKKRVAVR